MLLFAVGVTVAEGICLQYFVPDDVKEAHRCIRLREVLRSRVLREQASEGIFSSNPILLRYLVGNFPVSFLFPANSQNFEENENSSLCNFSMDGNNWTPATQGESNGMDGNDWRNQLTSDARNRIVNKIMETLKKRLPVSGSEGLAELQKFAIRFEEKNFTAATSQSQPDMLFRVIRKLEKNLEISISS
ncbi:hypothetical protein ACLOJK_022893 [Asimina triloba]